MRSGRKIVRGLLLILFSTLVCSRQSQAQEYFTLNDLYNISLTDNIHEIADFANTKGYYSDRLQGTYKDGSGNKLYCYKIDDDVVYVDYSIKSTKNSIKIFEDEINESAYFIYSGHGNLCLQVNDNDPSNNSGSFDVEYSINKGW